MDRRNFMLETLDKKVEDLKAFKFFDNLFIYSQGHCIGYLTALYNMGIFSDDEYSSMYDKIKSIGGDNL